MNTKPNASKEPIGSIWAFKTEDGEIEFEVISSQNYMVACQLKSPGPNGEPARIMIDGEDWLSYITDGRIIFIAESR